MPRCGGAPHEPEAGHHLQRRPEHHQRLGLVDEPRSSCCDRLRRHVLAEEHHVRLEPAAAAPARRHPERRWSPPGSTSPSGRDLDVLAGPKPGLQLGQPALEARAGRAVAAVEADDPVDACRAARPPRLPGPSVQPVDVLRDEPGRAPRRARARPAAWCAAFGSAPPIRLQPRWAARPVALRASRVRRRTAGTSSACAPPRPGRGSRGFPESVDTPAPVSTSQRRSPSISRARSTAAGSGLRQDASVMTTRVGPPDQRSRAIGDHPPMRQRGVEHFTEVVTTTEPGPSPSPTGRSDRTWRAGSCCCSSRSRTRTTSCVAPRCSAVTPRTARRRLRRHLALATFVDGRAFPMFGLLFGYGVAQIVRRQETSDRRPCGDCSGAAAWCWWRSDSCTRCSSTPGTS